MGELFTDGHRARLRDLIEQKSLIQGGNFKLSSGRISPYIFQLRQTTMNPVGSFLAASAVLDLMTTLGIKCVGGPALGAVPLAASVATLSYLTGAPVEAFFVRDGTKAYGAKELIDGYLDLENPVLLVDDVATSGASILKAYRAMRDRAMKRSEYHALVIIDREEGATELLALQGVTLHSIFKAKDFGLTPSVVVRESRG